LNAKEIADTCTDKWLMYQKFSQWCPNTYYVASQEELSPALDKLTTDLGVIKPVDGEEGHDVFIQPVAELKSLELKYPLLVQDFMDSSGGVPGIVEGLHDFRVALLNGKICYSYYRTPPQGSYLANVARGGSFEVLPPKKIPVVFKEIVAKIDVLFAKYPHRFYGIDFAMTPYGPKIIEMNSRLGLLPNAEHQVFLELKRGLAQTFHEMALS
jgi:glutathione synthase/RimK-type ligase-like ATP-grasp enzyme